LVDQLQSGRARAHDRLVAGPRFVSNQVEPLQRHEAIGAADEVPGLDEETGAKKGGDRSGSEVFPRRHTWQRFAIGEKACQPGTRITALAEDGSHERQSDRVQLAGSDGFCRCEDLREKPKLSKSRPNLGERVLVQRAELVDRWEPHLAGKMQTSIRRARLGACSCWQGWSLSRWSPPPRLQATAWTSPPSARS